ncbi:MAG: hypothetical protein ABI818_15840 [Acidobacteriota bacterium]
MDPGFRSPLVDFFRRGEVAHDVKLLAAEGAFAPRTHDQLALLILLSDDADPVIAARANATLDALPPAALAPFIARADVPEQMRHFFQARGVVPSSEPVPAVPEAPEVAGPTVATDEDAVPEGEDGEEDEALAKVPLSSLSIVQRMKLGMKGSKAQRSQLIRDSNKLVAAAVLSSPKLTESEVEAFSKMANVSEEVLRTIAMNRTWTKNYGVIAGLAKNPETPPSISMQMVPRLNARDLKMLSTDRNSPEVVRNMARRLSKKELL